MSGRSLLYNIRRRIKEKMMKGILILEIPDACIDCPCHFAYDDGSMQCGINKKQILTDDPDTYKPSWCPIVKHYKE